MIRNIIFFVFSTFFALNITKIDKNNRILLSLRLQSVSEVGDKTKEEKGPISHDHGSASSGDVKKGIDLYNRGEKAIEYLSLYLKKAKEVGDKHGEGNAMAILAMLMAVWVISKKP